MSSGTNAMESKAIRTEIAGNRLKRLLSLQSNSTRQSIYYNQFVAGELPFSALNEIQIQENEIATATTLNISFQHLLDNDLYLRNLLSEKVMEDRGNTFFSVVEVSNPQNLSMRDKNLLAMATDLVVGVSQDDAELFSLTSREDLFNCHDYSNDVDKATEYSFIDLYRSRRLLTLNDSTMYVQIPRDDGLLSLKPLTELGDVGGTGKTSSLPLADLRKFGDPEESAIITDLCENQFYGKTVSNSGSVWDTINQTKYFIATSNKGLFGMLDNGELVQIEFTNARGLKNYKFCDFCQVNEDILLVIMTSETVGTVEKNRLFYASLSDFLPIFGNNALREIESVSMNGIEQSVQDIWTISQFGEKTLLIPKTGGFYVFSSYKYGFPPNRKYFTESKEEDCRVEVEDVATLDAPFVQMWNSQGTQVVKRLNLTTLEKEDVASFPTHDTMAVVNRNNEGWYWVLTGDGYEGKQEPTNTNFTWNIATSAFKDDLTGFTLDDLYCADGNLCLLKRGNYVYAMVPPSSQYERATEWGYATNGTDMRSVSELLGTYDCSSLGNNDLTNLISVYFLNGESVTEDSLSAAMKARLYVGSSGSTFDDFIGRCNAAANLNNLHPDTAKFSLMRNSKDYLLNNLLTFSGWSIYEFRQFMENPSPSYPRNAVIEDVCTKAEQNYAAWKNCYDFPNQSTMKTQMVDDLNETVDKGLRSVLTSQSYISPFMSVKRIRELRTGDIIMTNEGKDDQFKDTQVAAVKNYIRGLLSVSLGSSNLTTGINWGQIAMDLYSTTRYSELKEYAMKYLSYTTDTVVDEDTQEIQHVFEEPSWPSDWNESYKKGYDAIANQNMDLTDEDVLDALNNNYSSYIDYVTYYYIRKDLFGDPAVGTVKDFSVFTGLHYEGDHLVVNEQTMERYLNEIKMTPTESSLKRGVLESFYNTYKSKNIAMPSALYTCKESTSKTTPDVYTLNGTFNLSIDWEIKKFRGVMDEETEMLVSEEVTVKNQNLFKSSITIPVSVSFNASINSSGEYVVSESSRAMTIGSNIVIDSPSAASLPTYKDKNGKVISLTGGLVKSKNGLKTAFNNDNFRKFVYRNFGFGDAGDAVNFFTLTKNDEIDMQESWPKPGDLQEDEETLRYISNITDQGFNLESNASNDENFVKFKNALQTLCEKYEFVNSYAVNISNEMSDMKTWKQRVAEVNGALSQIVQCKDQSILPPAISAEIGVKVEPKGDVPGDNDWCDVSFDGCVTKFKTRLSDACVKMVDFTPEKMNKDCFPYDESLKRMVLVDPNGLHRAVMDDFIAAVSAVATRSMVRLDFSETLYPDKLYSIRGSSNGNILMGVTNRRKVMMYDEDKLVTFVNRSRTSLSTYQLPVDEIQESGVGKAERMLKVKVLPYELHHFYLGSTAGSCIVYWLSVPEDNPYGMTRGIHAYVDEPGFKGFLDVVDFGSSTKEVTNVAYSQQLKALFVSARGSNDIYEFSTDSLKLKNDLVYDLNISINCTVFKTLCSGSDSEKMSMSNLYFSDRDESTYSGMPEDNKYRLVAVFQDNENTRRGLIQQFIFKDLGDSDVYSILGVSDVFGDANLSAAYRQFVETPVTNVVKTDFGAVVLSEDSLFRFENEYSQRMDITPYKTLPKLFNTADPTYCDYVLDDKLVLNCTTIIDSLASLYPYTTIDLKKHIPELNDAGNKLIVYDIDMTNWSLHKTVSYIAVYTNKGVYILDMGRVAKPLKYGDRTAIIDYFKTVVNGKVEEHELVKHHDRTLLSRFCNTRRLVNVNDVYDFVYLTTNTDYVSPTEHHGGHVDNPNISTTIDRQVFFGGSVVATAAENTGLVFAAVNSPITKYDNTWTKVQVAAPLSETNYYDYFYQTEVTPNGVQLLKNILNLNRLPFIYRQHTDHTWEMWVNVPSTMTPYLNRVVGSNVNMYGGKMKVETNYSKSRKNVDGRYIVADPNGQQTDLRLYINPNRFHIDSVTDVNICGSSLPMHVYREETANDGLFDGVQMQSVWNHHVNTVTDSHGVTYIMLEFQIWGSDEQSIHLSGSIAK